MCKSLFPVSCRLQPILRKRRLAREKLDFIIGFCEALCNVENTKELLQIQVLAEEALQEEGISLHHKNKKSNSSLPDHEYDHCDHGFSFALAESVAAEMLTGPRSSSAAGAFALKTVYRFICYNVDWIQVK